ncbi:gas vesicle protein GvpD P-loop domain-containing protein [Caldiplasma sukawensis]
MPDDIFQIFIDFFNQKFGKSLVIKGNPGTGKTTFVLELANKLIETQPVYYLSSRFTDEPLKESFPIVEKISYRFNEDKFKLTGEYKYVVTESLQKLAKKIEEETASGTSNFNTSGIVFNFADVMPELNSIYSFVDTNIDKGPVIIIDSIEAISNSYGISDNLLFSILQNDIVEKSGGGLIAILETSENKAIEYYSDGSISTRIRFEKNYLYRYLSIEKMRGVPIGSSPFFPFSLKNGRFNLYPQIQINFRIAKINKEMEKESDGKIVMGDSSLIELGINKMNEIPTGSIYMIHIEGKTDRLQYVADIIKNNMIVFNLLKGNGVVDSTSSSYDTRRYLEIVLGKKNMKNYLASWITKEKELNTFTIEGKSLVEDFSLETIDYNFAGEGRMKLYIFSSDYISHLYGENYSKDLLTMINNIRSTGAIVIFADDKMAKEYSHYATVTIHLIDLDGLVYANIGSTKNYIIYENINELGLSSIGLMEVL